MANDIADNASILEIRARLEKAEREVAGLRADMAMLECELGRRCYHCKQPIHPFEQKKMFNPAPSAASGGTWLSVHEKCLDALKEPKND